MGLAPDWTVSQNQAELKVVFLQCGVTFTSDQSETNKLISLSASGRAQKCESQRRKTAATLSIRCLTPLAIYYL